MRHHVFGFTLGGHCAAKQFRSYSVLCIWPCTGHALAMHALAPLFNSLARYGSLEWVVGNSVKKWGQWRSKVAKIDEQQKWCKVALFCCPPFPINWDLLYELQHRIIADRIEKYNAYVVVSQSRIAATKKWWSQGGGGPGRYTLANPPTTSIPYALLFSILSSIILWVQPRATFQWLCNCRKGNVENLFYSTI